MAGVAADILTGFLGSGKTTLLRHLLEHGLDGRRVAVIMNELGEIGVDGRVITGLKAVEQMVELSSGCICCSIGAQFGMAIREILATAQPHLIVIETTGIAEPYPLIQQVQDAGLSLDAVITVVDAENLDRCLAERPEVKEQIEAADFLVLNKIDLVDAGQLKSVERKLGRLNPRAVLTRTEYGRVESDVVFGTSVGRLRKAAADAGGVHHAHESQGGLSAWNWRGAPGEVLVHERLQRFLERLPDSVYRAKGIVRLAGQDAPSLFHFTCGRVEIERFPGPPPADLVNQGVFIGRDVAARRDALTAALARCRPGESRLERLRGTFGLRGNR